MRSVQHDSLPESPVDWEPIPLGPGQSPSAMGDGQSFQFTRDAGEDTRTNVRRNPDQTFTFISRWPERW